MSKTEDLRRTITATLNTTTGATYYRNAPKDATFPYKTFRLTRVNLGTTGRDDVTLCVDVWDHAADPKRADQIADQIEALYDRSNLPQNTILPTFYRDTRLTVDDPDLSIQHIQLHFYINNYEREE